MRISDWSSDVCSSDLDYWHRLLPRAKYRRGRSRKQGGSMVNIIKQRRPLSERPAEAGARDVAGHWEADFMLFAQYGQCILVAHERASRFTFIERPARKSDGYGKGGAVPVDLGVRANSTKKQN